MADPYPVDLDRVRYRARAARTWLEATRVPLVVREHVTRDVPALVAEVQRLRALDEAAQEPLAALLAERFGPPPRRGAR